METATAVIGLYFAVAMSLALFMMYAIYKSTEKTREMLKKQFSTVITSEHRTVSVDELQKLEASKPSMTVSKYKSIKDINLEKERRSVPPLGRFSPQEMAEEFEGV